MSARVGVCTGLESYRIAAAELPRSATRAESPVGAVAVVSGTGAWAHAAREALAAGALGVVVSRPGTASVRALGELAAAASDRPVILERPLLRADLARSVTSSVAGSCVVAIECHAPQGALEPTLRDALGWARALAGAPLALQSAFVARGRGTALFETAAGEPVPLVFAAQAGAPPSGRIRVTALGTTLVEIEGDETDLQVTAIDAVARHTAGARYERPERLALRRAIEALSGGGPARDLPDFAEASALVHALLETTSHKRS